MTEQAQRDAVLAQARRWIGTPYHHAADLLGVGIDCGMLIVRVFVDSGVVPAFDPRPYSQHWYMHRDDETYLGWVLGRASPTHEPTPGDVVVFKHGRTFSHGGVVIPGGKLRIIHASAPAGICLEEEVDGSPFASKERRYFNPWAKADAS